MATVTEKKKSKLTPDEINLYWDAYFAAVDTLITAESKMQELESNAADLGERSGYRANRLRIGADIELLRARRIAFNAEQSKISPPSQQTVDGIVKLVGLVAAEEAKRNRADTIVKLATKAIDQFAAIQSS